MIRISLACLVVAVAAHGQGQLPVVDVATVERREVASARTFVGTIQPERVSVIGTEVDGAIVELPVDEGDRVKKGEPLVVQEATIVDIQLRAAKAQVRLREVMLQELENGSRPEEVAVAKARVARDEAEIVLRKWKHDAALRLFDQGTVAENESKDTEFALRAAEAQLEQDRATLALAEKGPRKERIEQARVQLEIHQAELARLTDLRQRHTVRAPFDGYVIRKWTEVGQYSDRGENVVTLAALDEVDVVVPVQEALVHRVRLGAKVRITLPSQPAAAAREGTIIAIVPQADVRGRTLPVKIRVKNAVVDGVLQLRAGMLAIASAAVGQKEATLLVPKDAIVLGGPQPTVFVVDPENKVHPVPVVLGSGYGAKIGVTGGLEPGAQVVVRGNERLRPGMVVRIRD